MEPRAKSIVLGVTGSIAAYKAADLASRLTKLGHSVHVVMTKEAREFITPLTLQVLSKHPVVSDLFDEKEGWQPGHIELADRADLLLIAPATAQSWRNSPTAFPTTRSRPSPSPRAPPSSSPPR